MSNKTTWMLVGGVLLIVLSIIHWLLAQYGYILWIQRYSLFSITIWMFGIGGVLGYVFVMIEGTPSIRIIASLFAFFAMILVGIALAWSANTKEYLDDDTHEVFVIREAYLWAADRTYYQRVNWFFGKKIAMCDDGEDQYCRGEIDGDELIVTECYNSVCVNRRIPLE